MSLCTAWKYPVSGRKGVRFQLFVKLGTRRMWVVSYTLWPLIPGETRPRTHYKGWGGGENPSRSGRFGYEKNTLPTVENWTRIVQHVAEYRMHRKRCHAAAEVREGGTHRNKWNIRTHKYKRYLFFLLAQATRCTVTVLSHPSPLPFVRTTVHMTCENHTIHIL